MGACEGGDCGDVGIDCVRDEDEFVGVCCLGRVGMTTACADVGAVDERVGGWKSFNPTVDVFDEEGGREL